jgi:hypothetical protein
MTWESHSYTTLEDWPWVQAASVSSCHYAPAAWVWFYPDEADYDASESAQH